MHRFNYSLVILFSLAISYGNASGQTFSSGDRQIALLELYTSEGCSSCPPADRWLSKFTTNPDLWKRIVPVAFHVDYWNYLGWEDRFSDAAYSQRQHQYANSGYARTVYTPGFFSNGREWRGWFSRKDFASNLTQSFVGPLDVEVMDERIVATFKPSSSYSGTLILNVAYLGSEIETDVKEGENEGKKLKHDFVVLVLKHYRSSAASNSVDSMDSIQWQFGKLKKPDPQHPVRAMAFWITRENDPTPIQATGGWVTR